MKRALAAAALLALAAPGAASAHGIGGVQDLPVAKWLFFYGAAVVLVISFVALGVLWKRPLLDAGQGRPLPRALQRVLLSRALSIVLGALSVLLFALVWAAAAFGPNSTLTNIAPTFVWVVFWLGMVLVSVLLGDVWRVLNPWRAVADAVAWAAERLGLHWEPLAEYPDRLGRYPAAFALFAFTAFELTYSDPSSTKALAVAIGVYSWAMWLGAAVFGREAWFRYADGFAVYFGLLARMAPFAVREGGDGGEIVVRPPLAGLAVRENVPGTVPFVAVMLGSVAFDGFSRTSIWQNRLYDLQRPYVLDSPGTADLIRTGFNLAGLVAGVVFVLCAFLVAVRIAAAIGRSDLSLADLLIGSLIPISAAYVIAHYFSLFVIQGQFAIPLLSDPLARGWDLFGTQDFQPNLSVLKPRTTWYVQVGALVIGHVMGLAIAHDRAVAVFRSAQTAVRTQYAMLALMVLYTVGGLWILSHK